MDSWQALIVMQVNGHYAFTYMLFMLATALRTSFACVIDI